MSCFRPLRLLAAALALGWASPAAAQSAQTCRAICAPTLHVQPSLIRSHLLSQPRFRRLNDGSVGELPSTSNLEVILLVAAKTAIPRTSLFTSVQWLPTAKAPANPFTQYSASELGDAKVRANLPSVTLGGSVDVVTKEQTGGWLGLSGYVADLFSRAARPGDESDFTHKLDLGATAHLGIFNRVAKKAWLHAVDGVVILDHVATGLPRRGDEVPKGERVFLDDVHNTSLIVGLSIPVAPLVPRS
jgi:hypothetical protein